MNTMVTTYQYLWKALYQRICLFNNILNIPLQKIFNSCCVSLLFSDDRKHDDATKYLHSKLAINF